jgi:CHAD domain-containing protein
MKSQQLLLPSLDTRWKKYQTELIKCRAEYSEESVHELRVATRRLLAVLELLRAINPNPGILKLRRTLKDRLDSLDEVRDIQVILVEVNKTNKKMPELEHFNISLLNRERELIRKTKKGVRSLKTAGFTKRLDKVRKLLESHPPRGLDIQLLQVVDHAYITTIQLYAGIDPSQSASIHRVRLAFKKLRYLVELVFPLLETFPENNLDRMHDYQDMMGDIQDTEVLLAALEEYAKRDASSDLSSVRRYYDKRHDHLISRFLEEKSQVFDFWRTAPDKNFPWENSNEPVSDPARPRS